MGEVDNKHKIKVGVHFVIAGIFLAVVIFIMVIVLKLFSDGQNGEMSVGDIKDNMEPVISGEDEDTGQKTGTGGESLNTDKPAEIVNTGGNTLKKRIRTPGGFGVIVGVRRRI